MLALLCTGLDGHPYIQGWVVSSGLGVAWRQWLLARLCLPRALSQHGQQGFLRLASREAPALSEGWPPSLAGAGPNLNQQGGRQSRGSGGQAQGEPRAGSTNTCPETCPGWAPAPSAGAWSGQMACGFGSGPVLVGRGQRGTRGGDIDGDSRKPGRFPEPRPQSAWAKRALLRDRAGVKGLGPSCPAARRRVLAS